MHQTGLLALWCANWRGVEGFHHRRSSWCVTTAPAAPPLGRSSPPTLAVSSAHLPASLIATLALILSLLPSLNVLLLSSMRVISSQVILTRTSSTVPLIFSTGSRHRHATALDAFDSRDDGGGRPDHWSEYVPQILQGLQEHRRELKMSMLVHHGVL